MKKRRLIIVFFALVAVVAFAASPALKRHNDSVRCSNQMHVILYVATLAWPTTHDEYLPTNFLSLSNELIMPEFLICPGDHALHPAVNWQSFAATNCSYELITPGLRKGDTNSVFLRCPIHGYTGYADDRLLDASGKLIRPQRMW